MTRWGITPYRGFTAVAVSMFWFVLIATGATLGVRQQQIQTAQQAGDAVRPLAGDLASYGSGSASWPRRLSQLPS